MKIDDKLKMIELEIKETYEKLDELSEFYVKLNKQVVKAIDEKNYQALDKILPTMAIAERQTTFLKNHLKSILDIQWKYIQEILEIK